MNIAVLPGDGIGKEVTAQAVKVLKAVVGGEAEFTEGLIGGAAVKATGVPLPPETFELAKQADAILFGAVGGPGDESGPRHLRPGLGLLTLRRETVAQVGMQYPDVELTHLFVDAASMQLLRAPKQFDVMVAPNMFGDILSDAAAMLTGSIGMLPSASIGEGNKGLYEPVHGSAPDIAGKDLANPLAAILSAAMLLRHSFGRHDDAARIEGAVRTVLAKGYRTRDILQAGTVTVGTAAMGDAVLAALT